MVNLVHSTLLRVSPLKLPLKDFLSAGNSVGVLISSEAPNAK